MSLISGVRKVGRLAVLAIVCAACSGGSGAEPGVSPQDRDAVSPGNAGAPPPEASGCADDGDCAAGEGCVAGMCLPLAQEGRSYSVILTPPAGSDLIQDQFAGVAVQAGGTMDLTMTDPVDVRGIGAFTPDAMTPSLNSNQELEVLEPLGGLLVATAPGVIAGTQFRSEAFVQASQKVGEDWTFVLRLLPGIPYEVTFVPSEDPARGALARLPTYTFAAQFSKSETGFKVLVPSKTEYLASSVVGVIFLDEEGSQPVQGAKVSSVGSGMKGTTGVTDDQGVFRVVVPPGAGHLTLRVEPGKGSPPFPIREFVYAKGARELVANATPRFVVGPVPPVRDILIQVFSIGDQTLTPVPQARIEAEGQAGGGLASGYSVTGVDGIARLSLLEGVYALAVIPPEGSAYAARVSTLDLSASQDTNVFHVPLSRRTRIAGVVVRDDDGAPVVGAAVTFQSDRVSAFEGTSLAPHEATASAVTGADGAFEVLLDPGVYAMTVIPPPSAGLARFGQPEVDLTVGDAQVTVRLVRGALVRGRVLAAGSGSPVPGAHVQVFFDLSDEDVTPAFVGTSYASSIQMVGSAGTDAEGRFSVVVPDTGAPDGSYDGGGDGPGSEEVGFGLPAVEVLPVPASS